MNKFYIGITLKRLRKSKKFTQEDLAFECSLVTKTISLLETNRQEPLLSTLCILAAALGMDLSEFMKEIENDMQKTQLLELQPK